MLVECFENLNIIITHAQQIRLQGGISNAVEYSRVLQDKFVTFTVQPLASDHLTRRRIAFRLSDRNFHLKGIQFLLHSNPFVHYIKQICFHVNGRGIEVFLNLIFPGEIFLSFMYKRIFLVYFGNTNGVILCRIRIRLKPV